jgi:hypothetical protein
LADLNYDLGWRHPLMGGVNAEIATTVATNVEPG